MGIKLDEISDPGLRRRIMDSYQPKKSPVEGKPIVAVCLILPFPPSANRYWRNVKGRMVLSKEARDYRKTIANSCFIQGVRPEHCAKGSISLKMAFYRPQKRGDLDNLEKQPIDALRGILYADDKQIVEIHAKRFDDKERPRLEITVMEVS